MPQARGLIQAYQLRDFAAAEALALQNVEVKTLQESFARARAVRDYASVWESASDRIRIMRGRGLPKSVTALNDSARRKRKPRVIGPLGDAPPEAPRSACAENAPSRARVGARSVGLCTLKIRGFRVRP